MESPSKRNGYEPPADMSAEQKQLIEDENKWRQMFAEQPHSIELQNPYFQLENVFDHAGEYVYQDETEEEKKVPKILTQSRKLGLRGTAIVTKEQFTNNWNNFTQGILNGLDWSNIFVAGGAVLGNLAADGQGYNGSDIDIFIHGIHDDEEANEKLRHIHRVVTENTKSRGDVIRTNRAVTILNSYPYRHVQIILRMYKTPAEVLLGFDIDSCTVGYDGKDVWAMERFKRALTKRYNLVNMSRRSTTYEQRLYKYSKRGFAVAVPNLDKSRVNNNIFTQQVRNLRGLSKLLLYDHIAQKQSHGVFAPPVKRGVAVDDVDPESSDYNGDLQIPWGPGLHSEQIMRVLNIKDKKQFFAKLNKNKNAPPDVKRKDRPSRLFERLFLDQSTTGAQPQKPIEWIKNNPAYQDYDNGFKRTLMTGSFQPVVDEVWERDAYLEAGAASQGASDGMLSNEPGKHFASFGSAPLPSYTSGKIAPPTSVSSAAGNIFRSPKPASLMNEQPTGSPTPLEVHHFLLSRPPAGSSTKKESPKSVPSKPSFEPQQFSVRAKKTDSSKATEESVGGFGSYGQTTSLGTSSTASGGFSTNVSDFGGGGYIQTAAASEIQNILSFGGGSGFGFSPVQEPLHAPTASPGISAFAHAPTASPGLSAFGHVPTASPGLSAFGPQPGTAPALAQLASQTNGVRTPEQVATPSTPDKQQQTQVAPWLQTPVQRSSAVDYQPRDAGTRAQPAPTTLQQGDSVEAKPTTKLLLLVALLYKQNRLTLEERGHIKDLIIQRNELIFSALEVFELDQDLDELVDTFKRIVNLLMRRS